MAVVTVGSRESARELTRAVLRLATWSYRLVRRVHCSLLVDWRGSAKIQRRPELVPSLACPQITRTRRSAATLASDWPRAGPRHARPISMRTVLLSTPPGALGGNRTTALRWAQLLRTMGWTVCRTGLDSERQAASKADLILALHAVRARPEVDRWLARRPEAKLVVACSRRTSSSSSAQMDGPTWTTRSADSSGRRREAAAASIGSLTALRLAMTAISGASR